MTEFTIPAPELARLTHNALAFMPARSAVKVCRVEYFWPILQVTATDLFTIGRDFATVEGSPGSASIDLSREDLQELDKAARAAKKEDVLGTIRDADGFALSTQGGETFSWLDSSAQRDPEDLWERCDELLTRLEWDQETTVPKLLTLDPKMFSAFGKVKPANGKECIADLFIFRDASQILVKIGSTFRGAIMPVDRGEAAESDAIGPEGLWSEQKVNT